jgi:hypothetical protein
MRKNARWRGIHYPSDIEAERISGAVVDNGLFHDANFTMDYGDARAEARHSLGLQSTRMHKHGASKFRGSRLNLELRDCDIRGLNPKPLVRSKADREKPRKINELRPFGSTVQQLDLYAETGARTEVFGLKETGGSCRLAHPPSRKCRMRLRHAAFFIPRGNTNSNSRV